jgi:glycosyltransferase involved in cell wall biosynthesis
LAHHFKLPLVVKAHGSDILTLLSRGSRRYELASDVLKQADGIITVSRDLADRVAELGASADRVRVIYNGVNTSLFCPGDMLEARVRLGIDLKSLTVLFIGNLVHVKGLDILLDACGLLRNEGVEFTMYFIGQGEMRAALERQAAALGLANRIRMVGVKPHRELPDWFRAADIFVLPSRSEGVPNVLLEASACGTPYVASRVGGIPEIAHLGRGELVPPEDFRALAAQMKQYLTKSSTERAATKVSAMRSHAAAAAELISFLCESQRRFSQKSTEPLWH